MQQTGGNAFQIIHFRTFKHNSNEQEIQQACGHLYSVRILHGVGFDYYLIILYLAAPSL